MSEEITNAVKVIFEAGVASAKDHDDIIYDIKKALGKGITFQAAERKFKELAVNAGILQSRESQVAKIKEILSTATGLDTEEGYTSAVKTITSNVPGITERSAAAFLRWYCEDKGLPRFIRHRVLDPSKTNFATRFFAALEDKPEMTEAEADEIILGENNHLATSVNVKNKRNHWQKIRSLVNNIVGISTEEEEDEGPDEE